MLTTPPEIGEIVKKFEERFPGFNRTTNGGAYDFLRTTLTTLHQKHQEEVEKYKNLLRQCEPFLSDNTGVSITQAVYINPAEQMRRAAVRMEYEARLKDEVRKALTPTKSDKQ